MPTITIYLTDEEYTKYRQMDAQSQERARATFKEELQ